MTTRLVLRDELLDAQLLRAVGAAPYGGADLGECLQAARAVQGSSLDSWQTRGRRWPNGSKGWPRPRTRRAIRKAPDVPTFARLPTTDSAGVML